MRRFVEPGNGVLLRPVAGSHRHDSRLRVPPGVGSCRALRHQARFLPGKCLFPLHRSRVRPRESPGPDPTRPIHLPLA